MLRPDAGAFDRMPSPVVFTKIRRFQPELASLETRALLSAITATLSQGRLTITRDDVSLAIVVDVSTISARAAGRHGGRGSVVVEDIARFDIRRVKSITINPGTSLANISVNVPRSRHIAVTVNLPSAAPRAVASLVPGSGPSSVAGVTGVQSPLEQQVFDLVNAERAKAGVPPLNLNPQLVAAAQIHARDMAALGSLDHNLLGVAQPTLISRAQFVGYRYGWLGENIASGFSDASSLVNAWMNSPEHRVNILFASLTEAGVGVGRSASGQLFYTQEFASPGV